MNRFIYLYLFLWTFQTNAQYLTATIVPGKGQIGTLFTYTLTYQSPHIANIEFPNSNKLKKAIQVENKYNKNDFEIRYHDTIFTMNNQFVWQRKFEITPWDTGFFIIEHLSYEFDKVANSIPPIFFSVETDSKPLNHLTQLKEYFIVPPLRKETYWSTIVAIVAFLFIIIYWRYTKTKRLKATEFPKKEFNLNAYDKAKIQLTYLRLSEYWLSGKVEQHYQQLSQTIKNYLSDVLLSNSQELTSEEIAILFTEYNLPTEIEQRFLAILKEADKVKFANYIPSYLDIKKNLSDTEELINEMNKITNQKQMG